MLFAPPVLEPTAPPVGADVEPVLVDELAAVVKVVAVVVDAPVPPPLPVPGRHWE